MKMWEGLKLSLSENIKFKVYVLNVLANPMSTVEVMT